MKSFIDSVLDQLVAKGEDITIQNYVVPSRRVATFLSSAISKRLDKPVFQPSILSIEDYIAELSGLTVLTDLELLPLFYESYLEVQPLDEQDSYDDFLGWAPTILKDFNEIDRYLVPPEDFFNFLGNVKELDDWHWSLGTDQTLMVSKYLKFWKRLYQYYQKFTARCLAEKKAYQGLVYRTAFAKAQTSKSFSNKTIFLGLNALNTAESKIIQSLVSDKYASIYWDTDVYFLQRPYHEAGKFIRKYQSDWKIYENQPLEIIGSNFAEAKTFYTASASGTIGMVQVASHYLAQMKPEQIEDTVVVLADENLLTPLLSALPDNITNYNVTMGLSLDKLPIAGFVKALIQLFAESNEQGFYFKNILRFLDSPYTAYLLDSRVTGYKNTVARENLVYVKPEDLGSNNSDTFIQLLSTHASVPEVIKLIDNLIERLKYLLIDSGDKRMELEQLLGLKEVMSNLKDFIGLGKEMKDLGTLNYILGQLLPLKKLDFLGEPVKGLQIMGLLETRALDYKNVVMLSVNEGVLPAGKTTASYIPFDLKVKFGLPTYSDKDSVYAYHFYGLLHRTSGAKFIYNTVPGKIGSAEKSRFLAQLETNKGVNHEIVSQDFIYKNKAIIQTPLELEKTQAYISSLNEIAGKGFSPSALTSYVRNPIDFYRQKILRLDQVEEVEESIALNTMGSIIHEVLDKLYAIHTQKVLILSDFKEMKSRKAQALETAYQKFYPSRTKPTGRNRIIYEVASQFIHKMIGMDEQLVKDGNELIIKSVERHLSTEIDIESVGRVKLHGMVDRIDQLNGELRIIDYKTGKVDKGEVGLDPEDFDIMRNEYKKAKAFQILMYSYLYFKNENTAKEVVAGMISFKNFQNGFVPFSLKQGRSYSAVNITSDILDQFEVQLRLLITEIFDTNLPLIEKET